MLRRAKLLLAGSAAVLAVAAAPAIASAATRTFSTTGPVGLPASGPAGLYPWTIASSGMSGTTTDVNVKLADLSHERVPDLDALLVGPNGARTLFMSDIGDDTDIAPPGVDLTFNDSAAGNAPVGAPLISGSYRPTNGGIDPDTFVAPAPAGPYGATLAALKGAGPNGIWSLYLFDDDGMLGDPAAGLLGGWSVTITSQTTKTKKSKKKKSKGSKGKRRSCRRFKSKRRRIRCKCKRRAGYRLRHPRRCRRVLKAAARR